MTTNTMKCRGINRLILAAISLIISISTKAKITTTTSGLNTVVTVTDTLGTTQIADWESQKGTDYKQSTSALTVNFEVRRGTKIHFTWSVTDCYYDQIDILIDGTSIVSASYDKDHTAIFERMYKEKGTHKLIVKYTSKYGEWGGNATVTNFIIDHNAGQGEDGMLPFHPTTVKNGTFSSDAKWYNIRYGSKQYYLYAAEDGIHGSAESAIDSAYYWTFTGSEAEGFQIYNMKTGASKPLTIPELTQKSVPGMGIEGVTNKFMLGDNGEGYVFYTLPDTASFYLTNSNTDLLVYKPTTIWKVYNTSTTTRAYIETAETPTFIPITSIEANAYSYDSESGDWTDYYDMSNITVDEGKDLTLYYYAMPKETTETGLTYSIDNATTVSVTGSYDYNGTNYLYLTAQNGGTAHITLQSTKRPEVQTTVTINVTSKVKVTDISLDVDSIGLLVGEMHKVKVTVLPANAYDSSLSWTNTNPSVCTISSDGTIYALAPGMTTLTAKANDGSGVTAKIVVCVAKDESTDVVEYDQNYLYATHEDGSLTAIPKEYIESKTYNGNYSLSIKLKGGQEKVWSDITSISDECPVTLPRFTSYKFNDKFNDQLYTTASAEESDLANDTIIIPVGCIGKRLTASFQLANDTLAHAWVDTTLQHSKQTRQRFDHPITYTVGHSNWHTLQLMQGTEGNYAITEVPFGSRITIKVDWLCDKSTTDYKVPRIDIKFGDCKTWTSSQWINNKVTYTDATITINGGGVFPDMEQTAIQIKGRGNSSWSNSYMSKNPYHFKFETAEKPLGMTKGKHWVLLANKQSGSLTANAIAYRAASMLKMASPCHIIPVELYINGSYRGNYNLTERVGLANNSVDLDNDSLAAIIELDTYTDEAIITSNDYYYNLPIKLKDAVDDNMHNDAATAFDVLTNAVGFGQNYDELVDIDHLASFLVTNELIANCELKHPKSVFAYNENIYDCQSGSLKDPTPWVFGPMWDCDWAFGYQQAGNYFINSSNLDYFEDMGYSDNYGNGPQRFWKALRSGSEAVDKAMYSLLYHFITQGDLEELIEYCDDYYNFAHLSLAHNRSNATDQKDYSTDYGTTTTNAKTWLAKRAATLFANYQTYDLSDDEDVNFHPTDEITATSQSNNTDQQHAYYDLQGRRVSDPRHHPGIYIQNGRKIIVK